MGPQAYVRLYKSNDPSATVLWLLPDQSVSDVVDFKIDEDVDSLQILDRPPVWGERGYDAFVKQIKR